jgi:hypothetical protein
VGDKVVCQYIHFVAKHHKKRTIIVLKQLHQLFPHLLFFQRSILLCIIHLLPKNKEDEEVPLVRILDAPARTPDPHRASLMRTQCIRFASTDQRTPNSFAARLVASNLSLAVTDTVCPSSVTCHL